ncbi:MAG: zinc-binding dehydrogenase [Candidatus Latescibacteria bacterium]|nr:zinc-binding dehydrogenase [Candidatus Latescibacterota bacterium]NIO28347.1 zinc-binding dehydrogenase [Candidatus Latescibacterota bacterium]NIO55895.1 zinc-binding dehydrogenase [Candidatus Latescibacterota bacterium]NIT01860.1 zinc-binding dehydrogenase [Candidatus Latescibacterota bacterium]
MQDEMWALVYDKSRDVWEKSKGLRKAETAKPVLDEARDPLDAGRVIVKVIYAGFCGSDRGIWFRNSFKGMIYSSLKAERKTVRVIGHELLGEIVETGSVASARYGYGPKDIVSTESHIVCGKCRQCLIGDTHVCSDEQIIGITVDGCFAEYIKLPAEVLWRTNPKKIRKKVACLQEPFGNAVHACTKVDLRGKSVAIFGCGTIGLFTILVARALGASKIIGVEPNDQNADMAEKLGVDEIVRFNPGKETFRADGDIVEAVHDFGGDGVDVALEMAGYNSSVNNAIQSVRRGGDVILFGLKGGNFTIQDFSRVIVRGITLHSVIGRRIFQTWDTATNLLESKENHIQEKIYNVILSKGKDTIVHIDDYDLKDFEQRILSHPKVIIQW